MQPFSSDPGVSPAYSPPIGARPRPGNVVVVIMFLLAGLFLLMGVVVLQARVLIDVPTSGNPADYLSYFRTIRLMGFAGLLVLNLGVFMFLVGGILVGLFRSDLPETVRRSMIVMPGVLVIIWLLGFLLLGAAFSPPFIP